MEAIQKNMWAIWQGMKAKMDTVMDVGQEVMKSYWERMEAYQERCGPKLKPTKKRWRPP
jgi:hypothetical protein